MSSSSVGELHQVTKLGSGYAYYAGLSRVVETRYGYAAGCE